MTTTIAERSGELSRVVTVSENTRSTVVALQVGERALDRVRVVVEHPVAAVPGHRRRRHRRAEAGRGVLELELGVLVGGEAERPELLVPLRLHQPAHPHVVAHGEVLGVRRADVAELRLRRAVPIPRPARARRRRATSSCPAAR